MTFLDKRNLMNERDIMIPAERLWIPAFHRVHHENAIKEGGSQWIQWKLSFSVPYHEFEARMVALSERFLNNPMLEKRYYINNKFPVTFDDGYKDVLVCVELFEKLGNLQPIVFIPSNLLEDDESLLWFDYFYHVISQMHLDDLNTILGPDERVVKGSITSNSDIDENKVRLVVASGSLKNRLRNSTNSEQILLLNELATKFGLDIDPARLHKQLYLDAHDVRMLIEHGWMVGSHGKYHHRLTLLDNATQHREIRESIESILVVGGSPLLSFPDGKYNANVVENARKSGVSLCYALKEGNKEDPINTEREQYVFPRVLNGLDACHQSASHLEDTEEERRKM